MKIARYPEVVIIVSALSVLFLGLIDYLTGWEFGFFVFYFIPISFSAWNTGLRTSIIISFFSAITWYSADFLFHHTYSSPFFSLWNTLIRLISFLLISIFISKIADLLSNEKKISENLRKAMEQIKVLRGFLPICASCKKIRNDLGYWEQLETYIRDHSEADFTHGLCEDCAQRLYPSLFTDNTASGEHEKA
jgi:hypothetical protein